jgi:hypothetical protein
MDTIQGEFSFARRKTSNQGPLWFLQRGISANSDPTIKINFAFVEMATAFAHILFTVPGGWRSIEQYNHEEDQEYILLLAKNTILDYIIPCRYAQTSDGYIYATTNSKIENTNGVKMPTLKLSKLQNKRASSSSHHQSLELEVEDMTTYRSLLLSAVCWSPMQCLKCSRASFNANIHRIVIEP